MEEVRCAGAWWVGRWCVVAGIRSGDNFGITVGEFLFQNYSLGSSSFNSFGGNPANRHGDGKRGGAEAFGKRQEKFAQV